MNIKKALHYMVDHAPAEDKPVYEQIVAELFDHLNMLASRMEATEGALRAIEKFGHTIGHGRGYSCANMAQEALDAIGEDKS